MFTGSRGAIADALSCNGIFVEYPDGRRIGARLCKANQWGLSSSMMPTSTIKLTTLTEQTLMDILLYLYERQIDLVQRPALQHLARPLHIAEQGRHKQTMDRKAPLGCSTRKKERAPDLLRAFSVGSGSIRTKDVYSTIKCLPCIYTINIYNSSTAVTSTCMHQVRGAVRDDL